MPGCRAYSRHNTHSTDLDVVGVLEGFHNDFRSEFGRYFICECKDWSRSVDFTTIAKFCRVLDSSKCKLGIVFSQHGISGGGSGKEYASREILKVYQDRGIIILSIDNILLNKVAKGDNLVMLLREQYEKIRLDLITKSD